MKKLITKDVKSLDDELINSINEDYDEVMEKFSDVNQSVIHKLYVFNLFGAVTWGGRSFVEALAYNDLSRAYARADLKNRKMIPRYADFLNHIMFSEAYGSKEAVKAWQEKGGSLEKDISIYNLL